MLNNIEAVIFDLDGTLVDSMWLWKDIDREYLGQFGIKVPSDLQNCIEGMSFTETAQYFIKRFNLLDTIDKVKSDWNKMAWYKYSHEVNLKPFVLEFLQHLKKNNIKTGIATSNSRELVNLIIETHGLSGYFNSVRTSCEVPKGKPAPDVYLKVSNDLGVLPSQCLVFEDLVHGIMAGKSADMKVCAVYDDFSKDTDAVKRELAHYYIKSYENVLNNTYEVTQ